MKAAVVRFKDTIVSAVNATSLTPERDIANAYQCLYYQVREVFLPLAPARRRESLTAVCCHIRYQDQKACHAVADLVPPEAVTTSVAGGPTGWKVYYYSDGKR